MITAIVLLNVERNQVDSIAEELADIKGITEVYSITGKYDLAAIVRVKDNESFAALVTGKMLKLKGILKSETMVAFRAYSKHDLESMFSVGM